VTTQIKFNHPLLQAPQGDPTGGCQSQFACPTGRVGSLVGRLMAYKNAEINQFAVEALGIERNDQVLEIGFGPGHAIEMSARRATGGFVAGVDLSPVMVGQAIRRNLDAIVAGRVELCQGSVADLPYEYGRFTKVLTVNCYQFWPNQELNLVEIQRVMREGGQLALSLRTKDGSSSAGWIPGFTDDQIEETVGLIRWVGFRCVHIQRPRGRRAAVCILATR
jgi:ubiquinone/menaquinone biosynthesis C-methylase UbiE